MVATSEGMLYVTSVETRDGGECRNPVEYRSVGEPTAVHGLTYCVLSCTHSADFWMLQGVRR